MMGLPAPPRQAARGGMRHRHSVVPAIAAVRSGFQSPLLNACDTMRVAGVEAAQ